MTVLKTKPMAIHYSGEIRTSRMHILPGWAACCSGDKAYRIRREGARTLLLDKVTCKACLKRIAAHAKHTAQRLDGLQKALKEPTYE